MGQILSLEVNWKENNTNLAHLICGIQKWLNGVWFFANNKHSGIGCIIKELHSIT